MSRIFVEVFVSGPFPDALTYISDTEIQPGIRVRVPLGSRELIGITKGVTKNLNKAGSIKSIIEQVDNEPIIDEAHLRLILFASNYYLTPPGDLLLSVLPTALRKGKPCPQALALSGLSNQPLYQLTNEQKQALKSIEKYFNRFQCFLFQGVTGSGKTQVFSELIERAISRGQQSLLLVPEIGLTGQMVSRISNQLSGKLAISHSGLADGARAKAFVAASNGIADVLIGTRSALFTPMPRLGLILIDEEHDGAYKNQDGCRYSARDLAVIRGNQLSIPVVLSSATPSMETWRQAELGKYIRIRLTARPSERPIPSIHLVDARLDKPKDGLTQAARLAIKKALDHGQQALVFLNRRGYSPILMCTECGWIPNCFNCDAKPTLHRQPDVLWCHHCDNRQRPAKTCPDCSSPKLMAIGYGTERLEETLNQVFPLSPVIRVDRDTTSRRRAFETLIAPVLAGDPCILVGTQMLAKGHDFQNLSTVVVADADQGLSGADFRSVEHFAQLLTQVAGRAGRHTSQGKVLIQTFRPNSDWFDLILKQDYDQLARAILTEREQFQWPPEIYLAMITARSASSTLVFEALAKVATTIRALNSPIRLLGPAPSPIERRNRQYHGQLLILGDRPLIQWVLKETGPWAYKKQGKVMFQLDVDPWDLW